LQGPGQADVDLRWWRDIFIQKSKKEKGTVLAANRPDRAYARRNLQM
jgi:hypothetical protein